MNVGVCYFPEHWDASTRDNAVDRMADAGIEYVRMGEFAWGTIEPAREDFRFDWLDDVLERISARDMQAVLCTPTAAPPKWLYEERPSIRRARIDGTLEGYGSRRGYCFNSQAYREETDRIVDVLADRYADSEVVAGWQIDNEYGCHDTIRCYCGDCNAAFSDWLRERYDDVDALNEAWGTAFWSQQYDSFTDVDVPQPTPSAHHPSLLQEYYRFASDSAVEYNEHQVRLLREANDDWFLTHNVVGGFEALDLHALGETVDFLAWDSYPTGLVQTRSADPATADELRAGDPDQLALYHAICRGAGVDPFWIMEQQPGDINWSPECPQPGEGAMALWALHATAHGADAICYFRWRASTQGQEQYHSGLLDHAGRPDRGYRDAADAAADLDELPALAQPQADVAVLHDYENLWALAEQPHSPQFDYWEHLRTYFDALRARGVTVDVCHPEDDLSGYAAAVAPTPYLMDDERATHLAEFVESGGHLCCTIRTGFADYYNRVHETPQPGPLTSLVGATVERHETVSEPLETVVSYEGEQYDYRAWAEWLEPDAATVLGTHESGVGEGRAAITRTEAGDGTATYVGVWPEAALADELCTDLLDLADVPYRDDHLPGGVRLVERGDCTFCVNFTSSPVRVDGVDEPVVGSTPVGPFDVLVADTAAGELTVTDDHEC